MKKVMFISSTGGHLEELMQLKGLFSEYDYSIVTEKTKTTVGMRKTYGKKIHFLLYGSYTGKIKKCIYPFKLLFNTIKSFFLFLKIRPAVIVSTGAHTAGPMCLIGHIFGKKIVFIETFANQTKKSRTGKIVYKFADVFIVQWESMLEFYPKAIYGGSIF